MKRRRRADGFMSYMIYTIMRMAGWDGWKGCVWVAWFGVEGFIIMHLGCWRGENKNLG